MLSCLLWLLWSFLEHAAHTFARSEVAALFSSLFCYMLKIMVLQMFLISFLCHLYVLSSHSAVAGSLTSQYMLTFCLFLPYCDLLHSRTPVFESQVEIDDFLSVEVWGASSIAQCRYLCVCVGGGGWVRYMQEIIHIKDVKCSSNDYRFAQHDILMYL